MQHSPSSATTSYSTSQEIPYHFYGTQRLITMFITACYWFPSCARWIPPTPSHPISCRVINTGTMRYERKLVYRGGEKCAQNFSQKISSQEITDWT